MRRMAGKHLWRWSGGSRTANVCVLCKLGVRQFRDGRSMLARPGEKATPLRYPLPPCPGRQR